MKSFRGYLLQIESHLTPQRTYAEYDQALKAVRDLLRELMRLVRRHPDPSLRTLFSAQVTQVRRRLSVALQEGPYHLHYLADLGNDLRNVEDSQLQELGGRLQPAIKRLRFAYEAVDAAYQNRAHRNDLLILQSWLMGDGDLANYLSRNNLAGSVVISQATRGQIESLLRALAQYQRRFPGDATAAQNYATDLTAKLTLFDLFHALVAAGCPTTEEILSNPFDKTNWQVSSDWLQEQGRDDLANRIDRFVAEYLVNNPPELVSGVSKKHYLWKKRK